MLGEYIIAKYIRLSLEDAKTDSLSVENQRLLLDKYIADMDIPDVTAIEFVDNGHSGTNFERPAVQELLELVRIGRINCIIVKDMSRFGRNLIDTGYYIERMFPLYRTRFISISDAYDSANFEGNTGGMDIAFKMLVNEQYSRDLSKKIRTSIHAKAISGEHVRKNCAFGYKKVGKRLEIDELAAATVRLIYDLAKTGHSLVEIAAHLYAEKHPTPTEYKNLSYNVLTKDFACLWNTSYIQSILSDEQYIGTYIAGKTKILEIGSGKAVKIDESDWIKIPNHHPAIIDKAVFDAVRMRIDQKGGPLRNRKAGTWHRYKKITSPLKGKVFCGCCNHCMNLSSTKNAAFHCDFTQAAPDAGCYRLKMLASELETVVLKSIREQAQIILNSTGTTSSQFDYSTGYNEQNVRIDDVKCSLYERFVLGEINANEYKMQKAELDIEYCRVKSIQAISEKELTNRAARDSFRQIAEDAHKKKKLSQQLADGLIDKVRVFSDGRIEIVWKITAIESIVTEVNGNV